MVNLFGDWFNDLAAIVFVFILYTIYRIWLSRVEIERKWSLVISSAVIFIIAVFPMFSRIFWYDSNLTSIEGEYTLVAIAIVALITVIFGLKRIYSN